MTQQEARIELKQIRTYYNRIAERKKRLAELRSSMSSIRISKYGISPASGATKKDAYKLETSIDRATTLETQISDDIIAMSEAQQKIVKKIERLSEPYASVLTMRYVHLQRFEKIAVDMNYSYQHIKRIDSIGCKMYAQL